MQAHLGSVAERLRLMGMDQRNAEAHKEMTAGTRSNARSSFQVLRNLIYRSFDSVSCGQAMLRRLDSNS